MPAPTITDLFCGAGGSSLGAEAAGGTLVMAANHWQMAIEVHQANFPNAGHDCADISQADPRRYPATDILLASPECTNHSQARGISRKRQDPTLWDAPDPTAERSRATMWDVPRFAEQVRYALPNPPLHAEIPLAGHYAFLAPCPPAMLAAVPEICIDPPGLDRAAMHREFNAVVTRFFSEKLR